MHPPSSTRWAGAFSASCYHIFIPLEQNRPFLLTLGKVANFSVLYPGFFGVSTSGYYTWHKEHPDRQQGLDADGDQIEGIFDESGGT